MILKMSVGNIEVFNPATDNWKLYTERLEQYFLINDIREHLKVPTLVTLMGGTSYELLVTLCAPQKPSTMTFKDVVKTMSDHLYPKPCILAERYKFRQRKQYNGETISEYVADLKKLAVKCEFKTSLDENLRDQLVCGIQCETTRQRLFAEDELDFRSALAIAQSLEVFERLSNECNNYDDELPRSRSGFPTALVVARELDASEGPSEDHYNEDPMSCSDESETEDEGTPKNKRGRNKTWVFLKKFVNVKEAEKFVKSENSWGRNYTRMTQEGLKKFYRCNKVRKRGRQCAAELYSLFVNDSDDVFVYRTDADHDHDKIGARVKSYGIPYETKILIDELMDQRLKQKNILAALRKMDGIKMPTKRQVDNYVAEKRRAKFKKTSLTNCLPGSKNGNTVSTQIKSEADT
ncbi:uncharacterized protein [Maniola hyperantus]|uniref:uncharacterized protein n=1 Tax=Aphantopus hyperantus TaxID=2795564 RepID=UPI00374A8EA4